MTSSTQDPEAARHAEPDALKQLLLRGWMTHDAMGFPHTLERFGIATANELNRAAIRDMSPIEVARLLKVLQLQGVDDFAALRTFMTGAMDLLAGDYFAFQWQWRPPSTLWVQVDDCFAVKGMSRLGVIADYECGLFERILAWFNVLGLVYTVEPAVHLCSMHHEGHCAREIRFDFSSQRQREGAHRDRALD